ncbi:XrtA/PEP-CTERM system TPR-repeat protein PrsT [Variovorax sp. HJSM1_2]|uniref:XrtA/PEP-CTERM system TPR-repeat protein PrsT n=1 Tax=Variovorax sp. HJSM1_2 TaxID=3366263 RepID=UPI003BC5E962
MVLVACGGDDPQKMLTSAKEYLEKKDNAAAMIQVKNALQVQPDSGEGRYLLGLTLLNSGNATAAEIELDKARRLKFDDEKVVPLLAKSLAMQGKFRKITDELGHVQISSPEAKSEFLIALAAAYAAQGKQVESRTALNSALQANPSNADALLAQARNEAGSGNVDQALTQAESLVAKFPANPETWRLKADLLLFAKGDSDGALQAYQKAVEVKKDFLPGHSGAMAVYLQKGDLPSANKQLEAMKAVAANHPQTKYFEAQIAYQSRNFDKVRDLTQQILRVAPDNIKTLQLAGAAEYQRRSYLQAESYLSKVIQAAPQLASARRFLVLTYLRSGKPEKAMSTLNPALSPEPKDPDLLSLAGEVFLQNGNLARAQDYFAKAARLDPKDARKRTSLALTHLMSGDANAAFGELQDIAASDAGVTADLALISARLRRQEFAQALKAIDGLEKKQPDSPLAANLRGHTQLAMKDSAAARKSFEAAVKINPTYFPAVASLARLDLADKKPDVAKSRFEAVLTKEPKNGQALVALAELSASQGGSKQEVADLLNKAIAANPNEASPRLLLIELYLRSKDFKQALSTAQAGVSATPDNLALQDALGRTQMLSGDINQALTTFNRMISQQPNAVQPHLRLAEVYLTDQKKTEAAQSLTKALELQPDLLQAQRGLISLDVEAQRYQAALVTAKNVQRQRAKDAAGYILEGDVYVAQRKWDEAARAYQAGLKNASVSELAIKLHSSYVASGKKAEADQLAVSWPKEHPKDLGFVFYLGDNALARNDYAAAEKYYGSVVQAQPENAPALNNLAWVSGQLKREKALGYAEKAVSLMPQQPAFTDTLAMLLLDQNDYAKALEWSKKSVAMQPDNPTFKLNLAKVYAKSGDKSNAKSILTELAKLGDKFSSQPEVEQMLKTL